MKTEDFPKSWKRIMVAFVLERTRRKGGGASLYWVLTQCVKHKVVFIIIDRTEPLDIVKSNRVEDKLFTVNVQRSRLKSILRDF